MAYFDEDVNNSGSKSDYVYKTLRNNILNGTYAPGMALYIREISLQLDVSRTPVKEAISRLAYEGYVELLPNRCAIVSRISSTEVVELLELRESLECTTAFYAAQRRTEADLQELRQLLELHKSIDPDQVVQMADFDNRFHMAIAKATYNRELCQVMEKIFAKMIRISLPINRDRLQDSLRQHEAVLGAIEEGNAEAARRYMSEHNQDVLTSVKVYQYRNIHLFKS